MVRRSLIILIISATSITSASAFAQTIEGTILRTVEGDDWTLPDSVRVTPSTGWAHAKSGTIEQWESSFPPDDADPDVLFYHHPIALNWAEVHPAPGRFDWALLDRAVEEVARRPHVGFSLFPGIWAKKASGTGTRSYLSGGDQPIAYTDSWAPTPRLRKYPYAMLPPWLDVPYLSTGLAAGWDPSESNEYLPRLRELIDSLAERYAEHPRFAWVHVGCMDFAWGEGQFRPPWNAKGPEVAAHYQEAVATGLTAETYLAYLKSLTDIFADAFAGHEHQVVWTNHDVDDGILFHHGGAAYRDAKQAAWKYAVERGFGGRDGQVEVWMRYTTAGYGNAVDADGYLVMDEEYPPISEGRVWYTENENWTTHFVPDAASLPYIHTARGLRMLQMRRNWDWGGLPTTLAFPEFGRYLQLSFGKTPATSVDGWCWLRLGFADWSSKQTKVKNFERWVFQRDVAPDGMTEPACPKDISRMHAMGPAKTEYEARRTDTASGNDCIYFRVDPRWFGPDHKATSGHLYVTYFDSTACSWHVEYDTPSGRRITPTVTQKPARDQVKRTVVFDLPRFRASGSLAAGMDFRIVRTGGDDAVIRMVRIVKQP